MLTHGMQGTVHLAMGRLASVQHQGAGRSLQQGWYPDVEDEGNQIAQHDSHAQEVDARPAYEALARPLTLAQALVLIPTGPLHQATPQASAGMHARTPGVLSMPAPGLGGANPAP